MKVKYKIILSIVFSFIAIMTGVGLGSIKVPPSHIINIIGNKVFSLPLQADIQGTAALSIIWNLRLPRTLFGFFGGRSCGRKRVRNAIGIEKSFGIVLYLGSIFRCFLGSSFNNSHRVHHTIFGSLHPACYRLGIWLGYGFLGS